MPKETNKPKQVLKFMGTLRPNGVYEMTLKTSSKELYEEIWKLINEYTFTDNDTAATPESSSKGEC